MGRNREGSFKRDVCFFIVRLGDEESAAFLLFSFHVKSAYLFDVEAVERFKDTLDFDFGG